MTKRDLADNPLARVRKDVNDQAFAEIMDAVVNRRDVVLKGVLGAAGAFAFSVLPSACKTMNGQASAVKAGGTGAPGPFLTEIAAVEAATPLTPQPNPAILPPPAGLTDPNDQGWRNDAKYKPWADFIDTQTARGKAVAGVIGKWLAVKPYEMFAELRADRPVFVPEVGPAIITKHADVLAALGNTVDLTVDPYAVEMAKTTQGPLKHFILCTDDPSLYQPDSDMLRSVIVAGDAEKIRGAVRGFCESWTKQALAQGASGTFDYVSTLARFVPVAFSGHYLGVPAHAKGEATAFDPDLRGGDTFALDAIQKARYTTLQEGQVPTPEDLYAWGKDCYQNLFNNVAGDPVVQKAGLLAAERIQAYIDRILAFHKKRLYEARANPTALAKIPDNMITRLLRLQLGIDKHSFRASLLTNVRIRENVFGTLVGALTNQEEAMCRVVDSMLRLQEGAYQTVNGSFAEALQAALDDDAGRMAANNEILRKYMLEALRLEPQGEVLLRLAATDNLMVGGVRIKKNTKVFVGHGSAMQDIPNADKFDIRRANTPAEEKEVYLQHGYGRHRCLGQYVSPLMMVEALRAVLRLPKARRAGPLQMDQKNLYPVSFPLAFG